MMDEDASADLFRQPPDEMIDVSQGRVAYRRVGSGPDVLFVHGWPVSGATFRCLLPHLAGSATCHLIDLPGAGDAEAGPAPLTVHGHIEAVRAVIDHIGAERLVVVGHDSGGLIARYAVDGDVRVRGLGLIDTELPDGLGWRFRMFLLARHAPGFARMLGWAIGQPRVRRNQFILGKAFADRALLDREFDEFFLRPLHRDAEYRRRAIEVLDSFDLDDVGGLVDLHRRLRMPVHMVWGSEDAFFPVDRAADAVSRFDGATLTIVDGAGLFSHEERPAEVAAALRPLIG